MSPMGGESVTVEARAVAVDQPLAFLAGFLVFFLEAFFAVFFAGLAGASGFFPAAALMATLFAPEKQVEWYEG